MLLKERYQHFIDYNLEHHSDAETELHYEDPFQLLVAVILSAQCTDKRVNIVTPKIFKDFPDAESMSRTDFDTLFPYIQSISYPNNKTKHLIGMATMLHHDFKDVVPSSVDKKWTHFCKYFDQIK
ncbi:MAG: hypothetical protein HYZ42_02560 [Bacteroidetes bacterium]|nr:hypothetical protein [Bacteroidota bacterium]